MTQCNTLRALAVLAAATTSALGVERVAFADEREQCANAADQAQQLRDEGKYRRAREQLLVCARDLCPAPIKRDCLDWLTQVESVAPTVVLSAKDGTKDLSDVKVSVDGAVLGEHLDGKPVQLDLGKHTIKFEYAGQTKEETVILGAGQKFRSVSVVFGGASGTPTAAPPPAGGGGRGSLVPALVVGGIGVVAIGSFAFFGLSGSGAVNDLKKCKPNCATSDVDSARTKLIVADISLGVGVVALGVATYMLITRPKLDGAELKTGAHAEPRLATVGGVRLETLDFAAVAGGGVGTVGATF
jgi:hypothetical protein